jgi:Flp pilus assembly pilin Flp
VGKPKGAGPVLSYLSVTFAYVRARLGQLHDREQGVTAVEYALMVAIIALLLVGGFFALFSTVKDRYDVVGDCVASGPNPTNCTQP